MFLMFFKSIDMRFHWIRDRISQNQFIVTWRQGALNLADFFTKTLPVNVHKSLMHLLVTIPRLPSAALNGKHSSRQPNSPQITASKSNLEALYTAIKK